MTLRHFTEATVPDAVARPGGFGRTAARRPPLGGTAVLVAATLLMRAV